ncbi:MAG: ComF family protein [Rhodospirillaceae bacterium]|nr:ComF family protein [Rhodospirillaceae bacterium]
MALSSSKRKAFLLEAGSGIGHSRGMGGVLQRMFGKAGRGVFAALDLVLPERCPVCGTPVQGGAGSALCSQCFSDLHFSYPPVCDRCGASLLGGACSCPSAGAIARRRFALVYGGVATDLILKLKHGDRPDIANRLAVWMARAGGDVIAEADLLVPVPIHWTRLLSRQYNQAAELTRRLAALTGKPWDARALKRLRATPPQGHLGGAARRANVARAFAARSGLDVAGLAVVVIDDVVTTGATAEACAKVLRASGAASVDLLTAAAVLSDCPRT